MPDKLSQDAAAALAAGLTYGKWMAKQSPITVEKKPQEPQKVCQYCGGPIIDICMDKRGKKRKYCSVACMQAAARARKREAERE